MRKIIVILPLYNPDSHLHSHQYIRLQTETEVKNMMLTGLQMLHCSFHQGYIHRNSFPTIKMMLFLYFESYKNGLH